MNEITAMPRLDHPLVVGSVCSPAMLADLDPDSVGKCCDLLEIRLDGAESPDEVQNTRNWERFRHIPLLFTARRREEGGAGEWSAAQRMAMLEAALPAAACIDVEAASIGDMRDLISAATSAGVPWIASYHDFQSMPSESALLDALGAAKEAGAAVFKWAAMPHSPADLAWMADFQRADHGIPVASMGMGGLAVVSRLLCAQCGSVLNYGYLGGEPTAPGQWGADALRRAIAGLPRVW